MPSLKEVRIRIDSVNSTQKITSAMKLVAASKLRRAQSAILTLRPYAAKLQEILANLSSSIDADEAIYSKDRVIENVLLVVVTSNRGLCGPFNANVVKATAHRIEYFEEGPGKGRKVDLFCIGKKGADFFQQHMKDRVVEVNKEIFDDLSFENSVNIAEGLMQQFVENKYDRIEIIYNQFKNAAVQFLITEQFLPILPPEVSEEDSAMKSDYIFEPSKEEIVTELIPVSLKIQFFKTLLDSFASEHGARMTAMHKATDNAQELLKDLKLSYNKARQAAITNELVEIVSGAEALRG